MRILIVLHQFFPEFCSGTERVALNLARMAQRAGHHVQVLACAVNPGAIESQPSSALPCALEVVYEGLPVLLVPRAALPITADYSLDVAPDLIDMLCFWMREQRFDIAHVLHPMRMATVVKAAQECGLPYVMTLTDFFLPCSRINLVNLRNLPCRGPDQGQQCARDCKVPPWSEETLKLRFQQASALLASASACVAPSNYVAQRYRDAFAGLPVQVIPHGIDLLALLRHAAPRHTEGLKGDVLTLGYLGTIVPQKGLQVLLKALAALPDLQIRLRVAGGVHGDAAYSETIHRLANGDRRVEMLGQIDAADVASVLSSIDVLCLPSIVPESYSLVVRESAALGVPALVSDLGAPAELMAETGAGQVLPAGDVRAWAAAIEQLHRSPQIIKQWRKVLPLPLRMEEEAFFYESLYRQFRRIG